METVTFVGALIFVAMVFLNTPPAADAVCCYDLQGRCRDCSPATPFCGVGSCNIFGCNCDGGCRHGPCWTEAESFNNKEYTDAQSIVSAADLNGDGFLSIEEAKSFLEKGPNAEHHESVHTLDTNMDGFLTVDEIDQATLI